MVFTKSTLVLTILCFLLIQEDSFFSLKNNSHDAYYAADCVGKCNYRCSKASRDNMCIRACNSCCQRCNCVPPGTAGNRDVCPCYANMTTHGGKLKCP